jgi:hypothetical protein
MRIAVAAGVPLAVSKGVGGVEVAPSGKVDVPNPNRRGLYVVALGSVLFAATHMPDFPAPASGPPGSLFYPPRINGPDFGAAYGIRAGFQVNRVAGFEVTYEHSAIFTYTSALPMLSTPYYKIVANRLFVGMRFLSPGDTVRFVGSFAGGFTDDNVQVSLPFCAQSPQTSSCYLNGQHNGVDAVVLAEASLELDFAHVLIDFGGELQAQTTGTLQGTGFRGLYGTLPLINGGPSMRFGYRFW